MEIKVLLESKEIPLDAQQMGITMDTPETEILKICAPVIVEETGVNIEADTGGYIYTVRKMTDSNTIYILPKAEAGL